MFRANSLKVGDVFVQEFGPEYDRECLHQPACKVNMRLFDAQPKYRSIIDGAIEYLLWILDQTFTDYGIGPETGVAAPTVGLPLSIIAVRIRGVEKKVLINPEIVEHSADKTVGRSNCSSLRLKERIQVDRWSWVSVRSFDRLGNLRFDERLGKLDGGLTIQHEMAHLTGLLLTSDMKPKEVTRVRPDNQNRGGF